MTDLRVLHGWYNDGDRVLAEVQDELVAYGQGEDRDTGYLMDLHMFDWMPPLLDRLEDLLDTRFTIVAFQAYRNGAGTEWHTDDPFDEQAVLSLGVTRTFAVRRGDEEQNVPVHHGDLVVMPSGFQDEWQHRVVPDDSTGERVSLVFRTPKR